MAVTRQSLLRLRPARLIAASGQIPSTARTSLSRSPLLQHTRPAVPTWQSSQPLSWQRYASSTSDLKQTPLHEMHAAAGAKLVPFAGFSMPLTYPDQSQSESHKWTRENASLFDVSHMVQHKLSGPLACRFLETITPSAIGSLEKHHSTLSTLLDENGGIVDDTVITRLGRDSFYFVTNAGCRETDLAFIEAEMTKFLKSNNAQSDQITWHMLDHHSLIALQGPKAAELLQSLVFRDEDDDQLDTDLSTLYFGQSRWLQLTIPKECTSEDTELSTPSLLISRTGYTGEDGFEISIPPENGSSAALASSISKALLQNDSARWAGLAARDSLRLEAGMCLYGHDIDTSVTPPMAGLGWVVAKSRRESPDPAFNGSSTILPQLAKPSTMPRRRVGLVLTERGSAAREGAEIVAVSEDGKSGEEVIGTVTSGLPSPTLGGENIAMGYVKNGWHKKGTKVGVKIRGKVRSAEVRTMPFVESKFYRGTGK